MTSNLNSGTSIKRLTAEDCERLYSEFSTPPHVIAHCKAVGDAGALIAEALNNGGMDLDAELIRISGYAHDVMRLVDKHDERAGEMLEERGYLLESKLVMHHMSHSFYIDRAPDETDILCLADRLILEHSYSGIDKRIDYLIHKFTVTPERTERLIKAREETRRYMNKLEETMGKTFDDLFLSDPVKNALPAILKRVRKPGRYIGNELNSLSEAEARAKVPAGAARFCFCFPDLYEIGMSYMGLQLLYDILNKDPVIVCERAFCPEDDMADLLREKNIGLFALETKTPLAHMDIVGFTLQYEMSFTNILRILDLSGIPLRAEERSETDPLIIAGGPCAYNPEPLADYCDAFLIGDGEQLLPEFIKEYKAAKSRGLSKREFLIKAAAGHYGVYVPSLYEVSYNDDGTVKEYALCSDAEGVPPTVRRAIVPEIEKVPFPHAPIVPLIETVHDRAVVETFRGCTRGCRFCQAGMIYRPVRERTPDTIREIVKAQLDSTGHDELSLLSLSTSDYSEFEDLATDLMDTCSKRNVALSLPSLRLDSFSFKVLDEIQKYRKSGLTFAPEAGTQRLRNVINKGITENDIYGSVAQAVELGWKHIKLYFMIGLPTETEEDLDGIANIASQIVGIHRRSGLGGRFNVTVSVSNFVPKPHTPFQWEPQDTAESFRLKHDYLRARLHVKSVTFNYHDDETSVLEAVLARGDRRVGRLIGRAYELGCRFDSWHEHFDRLKWEQAMEETGIGPEFYAYRKREFDEVLPWDIIDSGILRSYLISEAEKARKETVTPDCRLACRGCGINRYTSCPQGGILNGK